MRLSKLFMPTLKEAPNDAIIASNKLLTESQTERKNHKDFVIGKIGENEVVMQH